MCEAFLLLGSNMGNRLEVLDNACNHISAGIGNIIKYSSVYETEPWGTDNPLAFINRVLIVETQLSPKILLNDILSIEKKLGRVRTGEKNQPRTIDIDILLYGDIIMDDSELTIPHPRMHLRKFVLVPLNELVPDKIHPVLKSSMSELLRKCPDNSWVKRLEN